jgi:putative hydrolases of HD superfamily
MEPGLDRLQILKLVLVHDIVEIDAGDTFGYDAAGHVTKPDREKKAADRIFNLLPRSYGVMESENTSS